MFSKKSFLSLSLILLLSFLSLAFNLFYQYYFYGVINSDFRVNSNYTNFEQYPYIKWSDITSGKLAKFLNNESKKGNVELLKPNVLPFERYIVQNNQLESDQSINFIDPETDGVYTSLDGIEKRPYKLVAFYKTGLYGTKYLVFIEKIKNKDSTEVFIPLVLSEDLLIKDEKVSNYFELLTNPEMNNFLSPISLQMNLKSCASVFPNYKSYCLWYVLFGKQKKANSIVNYIKNRGIVLSDIEKLPSLVKVTVLKK